MAPQFTPAFEMGQIVFLVTDTEQVERMVTGYHVRPDQVLYYLSLGPSETLHYKIEITTEKNWKK